MKTLAQLLEATALYDKGAVKPSKSVKKIFKELKRLHTPKSTKWGTYNPVPKMFKTAQKLGFRRVQTTAGSSQGSHTDEDGKTVTYTEHHPNHHMVHQDPKLSGHHLIINRKGYVYRTPEGGVSVGSQAGSMLNSLSKHPQFTAAVKEFKVQRDAKRSAKQAALAHAHSMPTE